MNVMKTMSVQELRDTIAPAESMSRTTFDPRTGEGKFQLDSQGKMRFRPPGREDEGLLLTADAYIHLGQMLGIPGAYIKRTPHFIMMPHMSYWLVNGGLAQITYATERDTIKLFSRGSLEPVSNGLILDAVAQEFGEKLQVHHVSHDLFRTVFSVVTQEQTEAIEVGDVVRVGITVENSYALIHPLTIATYIYRLSCSNGAVSTDNVFRFARRGGGDGDEHYQWVFDAIKDAHSMAELEIARLQTMKYIKFNAHLSDSLASIFTELGVPLKIREQVTNEVIDTRVENLYQLYDIITRVASNDEEVLEDPIMSHRLMRIGGRLASHPEFCSECHRLLS